MRNEQIIRKELRAKGVVKHMTLLIKNHLMKVADTTNNLPIPCTFASAYLLAVYNFHCFGYTFKKKKEEEVD